MASLRNDSSTSANDPADNSSFDKHSRVQYAELHCISNFSFLRGASHPEELVKQAALLNYQAIALTDECSLCGVVRAHQEAKLHGIKLIIGSEFSLQEGLRVVLIAPDRQAYGQLSHLISRSRRNAAKGQYLTSIKDIVRFIRHGLLIIKFDTENPRLKDPALMHAVSNLVQHFPDRVWLGLTLLKQGLDTLHLSQAQALAQQLNVPLLACGNVHMHSKEQKVLQDTLTAIRLNTTVQQIGTQIYSNSEHYLRSKPCLESIYPRALLEQSVSIAQQCHFSLDQLRYEYPDEVVPKHLTAQQYLAQLVQQGAQQRWPQGTPSDTQATLDKELRLIHELNYEYYFLTVYDIVQFARQEHILCQGRGSAANSAVCFCLFITEVDPTKSALLFERFISKERNEPPDIDVDFENSRREEVIQFIYKKYGRDRAALAATVITYRPKSALKDVGKALGLEVSQIEHLSKSFSWWDKREELLKRLQEAGVDINNPIINRLTELVQRILGFPRHLSQHVGGFIISSGPLTHLVPIENAAMPDRTIIQWDKNDLEALGLLKIDILALGMLSAIRRSFQLIEAYRGETLTMAGLSTEDPAVYRMLQEGDSIGLFQVESRAQMSMLPRLKPKTFYDLVIQVAIVRPGPIQGDMVHPYLKRRNGLEEVVYANDEIRDVLGRTLGVPIFQEQVIKLAMVAAGFSAGEADQLRRAMARWKRNGELKPFQEKLVNGMLERGYALEFANKICLQIQGFGEYGFPESHAASFALLTYVSAWLKYYEPAAFCCALLNSQPMGFYSSSQLVQDVRRHGINVHPVDVCDSQWEHSLERGKENSLEFDKTKALEPVRQPETQAHIQPGIQPDIQLGFRKIKGLTQQTADKITKARNQQGFKDLTQLVYHAQLSLSELDCLARAGALSKLAGHRYQARWEAQGVEPPRPLLDGHGALTTKLTTKLTTTESTPIELTAIEPVPIKPSSTKPSPTKPIPTKPSPTKTSVIKPSDSNAIQLPAPTEAQDVFEDYAHLGLSLRRHPLALLRQQHKSLQRCKTAAQLPSIGHKRFVQVAGLVTGRQRPMTASGVIFLTLEDETGNVNVIIWKRVAERQRTPLLRARLLRIKGTVEKEGSVIHVIAGHLQDCDDLLGSLAVHSRDFH